MTGLLKLRKCSSPLFNCGKRVPC